MFTLNGELAAAIALADRLRNKSLHHHGGKSGLCNTWKEGRR